MRLLFPLVNTYALIAATTTATEAQQDVPLVINDGKVTINWSLVGNVFFTPAAASSGDPFFFVHTFPANAGFYLAVEAYTTGSGPAWTGELDEFEIDCSPGGTGICIHFDSDGDVPTETSEPTS